jgi:predicted nucleotidyltransferase
MLQLRPEEKKVVGEYINLIRKHFPDKVSEIVLFGSKARGDSHAESDIDILLVIDTEDKQIKRKISDLCWDAMFNSDFKAFISPVIFFKKEYERYKKWNSSFLYNVSQEGVKL